MIQAQIFGLSRIRNIFVEVMIYTLNSYVSDFINFEEDDILLHIKQSTAISKSKGRSNFVLFKIEHDIVDCVLQPVKESVLFVTGCLHTSLIFLLLLFKCPVSFRVITYWNVILMERRCNSPKLVNCRLIKVFDTSDEEIHVYVELVIKYSFKDTFMTL